MILLCLCSILFAVFPIFANALPVYESRHAIDKIVVDGSLNEKSWVRSTGISLIDNRSGKKTCYSTQAKICYDRDFLYIAFSCEDDSINARLKEHDAELFRENEAVEVFLNQDSDDSTYFEFQVNPNNARFEALVFSKKYSGGNYLLKSFNPKSFKSAVKRTRNGWNVEMKISWDDIGRSGKPASVWRMNFYRLNKSGGKVEHSAWSPTGGNGHQPEKFGKVILEAERNGVRHYASAVWRGKNDSIFALTDGKYPDISYDKKFQRFTWWPCKGSTEWVELKFSEPRKISEFSPYWFDDSRHGGCCKIPELWQTEYLDESGWHPLISSKSSNKKFNQISVRGIRLKAKLQSGFSAGLYEIKFK